MENANEKLFGPMKTNLTFLFTKYFPWFVTLFKRNFFGLEMIPFLQHFYLKTSCQKSKKNKF